MKKSKAGRPKYSPVIPKGKFTFTDLEVANGVNPKTGKGKDCTTLTLRKWLKREMAKRGHSAIVHLKDVFADPNGKHGLGRKQFVYQRRAGVTIPKASAPALTPKAPVAAPAPVAKAKAPKTRKSTVASVPSTVIAISPQTEAYEAQKAAILAPVASIAPAPMVVPPPMLVDKTNVPQDAPAEPQVAETKPAPVEDPQPIVLNEGTEDEAPEGQPIPVAAPALVG